MGWNKAIKEDMASEEYDDDLEFLWDCGFVWRSSVNQLAQSFKLVLDEGEEETGWHKNKRKFKS